LFVAFGLGFIPDPELQAVASRSELVRALSLQAAESVQTDAPRHFEDAVKPLISETSELQSAGLREINGTLTVDINGHSQRWVDPGDHSTANSVWVAIELNDSPWGKAEFSFRPVASTILGGLVPGGQVGWLFAFLAVTCLLVFSAYLWFVLRRTLPPADSAIPHRVRQTLDTLVEGVLILDKSQKIAHANAAFMKMANGQGANLVGKSASELGWKTPNGVSFANPGMPWDWAISKGETVLRVPLVFKNGDDTEHFLSVNATPVFADNGACRGTLATFDDMTEMEKKNTALEELLGKLKHSRAEIHRQNKELKLLADRDPLTLCLNRRAFFAELSSVYERAARKSAPLGCVLIDVDRFKQINDRHGHAAGDQVLVKVAELLRTMSRTTDLVCRYGGEEFVLVLPQTDLEGSVTIAERIRRALADSLLAGISVTASFGVSALQLGPSGCQGLLDQADKALYAAKRAGRNRVMRFDEVPTETEIHSGDTPLPNIGSITPRVETAIPYPAVTALISALAYRDTLTAEHSRRVANLCVACAKDMLSQSDTYLLEVAALLHDIGKLGVPDSILFKPGPLTDEEWKVMRLHDRMGVEIINAAFVSEQLTRVISAHHAWFGGTPHDAGLPTGAAIPLPARILTIADAYDAMTSDRVYRKGRSRDQAFQELRRFAGLQFDPELVERMIKVIEVTTTPESDSLHLVSKDAALIIGTQIEKLAGAIDEKNAAALAEMATQLVATARACGISTIIDVASRLERAAAQTPHNWVEIVGITYNLLELCRSTQSVYLREARNSGPGGQPMPEIIDSTTFRRRRTDLLDALNSPPSPVRNDFEFNSLPPFPEEKEGSDTERIVLRSGPIQN